MKNIRPRVRYLSPARVTYLTRERARVRAYGEVV